jgi:hypothetical protein
MTSPLYTTAPNYIASSTAARSFIKKIRSLAVSANATEFLNTGAYLQNLSSLTI